MLVDVQCGAAATSYGSIFSIKPVPHCIQHCAAIVHDFLEGNI